MVRIMHSEAQSRGISDKAIYTSQTHDLFLRVGSSLAFFVVGLVLEIYWLMRWLRVHSKPRLSGVVFVLAILPFIFLVGRILLNLYKMGKLF
jgi:Na+/melibiose symporter-like transporter